MDIQNIGVVEDFIDHSTDALFLKKIQIAEQILKQFGSKVWIAGGLAVNLIVNNKSNTSNDIDIFCDSKYTEDKVFSYLESMKDQYHERNCNAGSSNFYVDECDFYTSNNARSFTLGEYKIQVINVINNEKINTLEDIFNSFDIANCQVAITTNGVEASTDALRAIGAKSISLVKIAEKTKTIQRAIKYWSRYGWKLDAQELESLKEPYFDYDISSLRGILTYKAAYLFAEKDFAGFVKAISGMTASLTSTTSKVLTLMKELENHDFSKKR